MPRCTPLLVLLLTLAALPAAGQEPVVPLRVFIDCQSGCDQDFLRTELAWIDHMRDRSDADVHVLVTEQSTGGGGREYTLTFLGQRAFAGRADTLLYHATSEDSDDERRRGLAHALALGLVPFAARTPFAARLRIDAPPADTTGDQAVSARDPWNYWTFRIGLNGDLSGQSTQRDRELFGDIGANRTTDAWKIDIELESAYEEERFEYVLDSVPQTTTSVEKSYGMDVLVVKSLTPRLSAGAAASIGSTTFGNTSLALRFTPAIEYNLFPYRESTRRQLTFRYAAGVHAFDYREVTIYGLERETRPVHRLFAGYATVQPWGVIDIGASFSQYLHDTGFYNAQLGGGIDEIRLFKGFSVSVFGEYELVRDQLHLPGRDLTPEEVLLRQRDVRTDYRYSLFFGVNYRFGSIFNNVVNPRFGNGGLF